MCLLSWKAQWNSVMRGTLQGEAEQVSVPGGKSQCLATWAIGYTRTGQEQRDERDPADRDGVSLSQGNDVGYTMSWPLT